MWARVARFEGDPADVYLQGYQRLRSALDAGSFSTRACKREVPAFSSITKSGEMLGVTLFDSEEAMREGDEAMKPGPGNAGSRSSVEFYEVPLHTL